MKEHYKKFWELFIKQKAHTISPDELTDLEEWKNANDNNSGIIREFERIFEASSSVEKTPSFDPDEEWQELQTIIKLEKGLRSSSSVRFFPWIARVAAAVILVLGFTFIFYQYKNLPLHDLNLQNMVQTDKSDKKIVELPDGSKVWLNVNTELLYPEEFIGDTRTLYLKGEAFFEVKPDNSKPFIIHSGSSMTTVLGTSFNLRAYGKEDEIRLTVVTGKVAFTLADEKEGVIVISGDVAALSNNTMSISHMQNEDKNFLSWKTGELVFDDSPLDQLIVSLERHYNIAIEVENSETLNCRFTGNFHETDVENAIKVITRATGTSYTYKENQYIIQGSGCN